VELRVYEKVCDRMRFDPSLETISKISQGLGR